RIYTRGARVPRSGAGTDTFSHQTDDRHHPGDGTDWLGKDHDALYRARYPEYARGEHLYHRRSDRVSDAASQSDAGETGYRLQLRERASFAHAPGPRRHHGRRDP